MIVLIDNYDSFTYNLVQYFGEIGENVIVRRNDTITPEAVMAINPAGIVISPGPSNPDHAGICLDLIHLAAQTATPLLGICLGHQAIGQAFGATIIQTEAMHGKTSVISHNGHGIFTDIPDPLEVTRYHSLIIDRKTLSEDIEITSETNDNIIMGIQHKTNPLYGVQFHPESIATQHGISLLKNFTETLQ